MNTCADRLIEVFNEARARTAGPDLDGFLGETCSDDVELKNQVLSLLQAHEGAGEFMKNTLVDSIGEVTEKPGDKLGHYKLLQQIGEGGWGVVYLAEQEQPVRRLVALKVIKLGMDSKAVVARFEAERQALAMMEHPNIAKVLEAGTTQTGRPFFVMELVRGIKITEYCDESNLSTEQRLHLFIQVCQAIQHAHQKGIIHRDIKPSNVLVTLHDCVPVPKVIDFGIAKATTNQRLTNQTLFTAFDQLIGTPAYMSPEQAEMSGLDIDTRSDIYSLGVLFYELLSGNTPFDAKELLEQGLDAMRKTIREKEPLRPSTRLASLRGDELTAAADRRGAAPPKLIQLITGDLDWIVMKCLEKDRTRRYQTANALAADLKRHLEGEPILARPHTAAYRFRKSLQKHQLVFGSAAAVIASLMAGLVVSLWQTVDMRRAQRATQHQLYVAKMNLARQAWDENNLARLRQLLEETADAPDRGFEWYYWQRQTHLELTTLRGHLGAVVDVSFSRNGERVLTASLDGTAKIWDARTGTELFELAGHNLAVTSASWSRDGSRIITTSADQTAIVWDAGNFTQLHTLAGHGGGLKAADFSPDGQSVVTGGHDQTARVWRTDTGEEVFVLAHDDAVLSVGFALDGQCIVTGSLETAIVWDAKTRTKLFSIKSPSAKIAARADDAYTPFHAAFSPDGNSIVTASQNQVANLWDAATGDWLFKLEGKAHWLSPRQANLPLVANFSPNSQMLIMGGLDFTTSVWRLKDRTNLFTLKGHEAEIASAAFSHDGERIVTGSYDHTAKIWDAVVRRESVPLIGHDLTVPNGSFSPDGERVVTVSWDGTAIIWEAATGTRLLTMNHGSNWYDLRLMSVTAPAELTDRGESLIIVALVDGDLHIRIFDANGRVAVDKTESELVSGPDLNTLKALLNEAPFPDASRLSEKAKTDIIEKATSISGHTRSNWVWSVDFSPDGERIVTGTRNGSFYVWDAFTEREPLLKILGHDADLYTAVFAPDGKRVLTAAGDGTAKLWDASTGQKLLHLNHSQPDVRAAFSPDGEQIVTVCEDGDRNTLEDAPGIVWDVASDRKLFLLEGHRGGFSSVAFSHDGRRIVTGGIDGMAIVWDALSGRELLRLAGHKGQVVQLNMTADDLRIITGAFDNTTRVWDAVTGEELLTIHGRLTSAISPDGRRLLSGPHPPVMLWEIATSGQVESWRKEEATARGRIKNARER